MRLYLPRLLRKLFMSNLSDNDSFGSDLAISTEELDRLFSQMEAANGNLPEKESDINAAIESDTEHDTEIGFESESEADASGKLPVVDGNGGIPTRGKIYECCGKGFSTYNKHASHRFERHSSVALIHDEEFRRDPDGKFTCPGCGKRFGTVSNFRNSHSSCIQAGQLAASRAERLRRADDSGNGGRDNAVVVGTAVIDGNADETHDGAIVAGVGAGDETVHLSLEELNRKAGLAIFDHDNCIVCIQHHTLLGKLKRQNFFKLLNCFKVLNSGIICGRSIASSYQPMRRTCSSRLSRMLNHVLTFILIAVLFRKFRL